MSTLKKYQYRFWTFSNEEITDLKPKFENILKVEMSRDYENVWEWIWNKSRIDKIDFNISREHNWKTGEYNKPLRIIISSDDIIQEHEIEKYCSRIILTIKSDLHEGEFFLSDWERNKHKPKKTRSYISNENTLELKERFKRYLLERKAIHLNDSHSTYKKWNELIEMLSESEIQTINLLRASSKEEVDYISEVMEEIAERLDSIKFLETLKEIDLKYPECKLTPIIEIAEKHMKK